jgi:hypothetical protein
MSGLEDRNARAMIDRLKALDAKISTLLEITNMQGLKIATLSQEVVNLKTQVILLSVK